MNRQTSVYEPRHVDAALRPVLTGNQEWRAKGYPIRQPRTGWYAEQTNASFSLLLSNITMDASSLTILAMRSYGPEWVNSMLSVRIQVERNRVHQGEETEDEGENGDGRRFEIDGHHELRISIHFPHKFLLPGGPLEPAIRFGRPSRSSRDQRSRSRGSPSVGRKARRTSDISSRGWNVQCALVWRE